MIKIVLKLFKELFFDEYTALFVMLGIYLTTVFIHFSADKDDFSLIAKIGVGSLYVPIMLGICRKPIMRLIDARRGSNVRNPINVHVVYYGESSDRDSTVELCMTLAEELHRVESESDIDFTGN
jgi:hypothetical protein